MLVVTRQRAAVRFTPRQLEILERLRAGDAPKEIAGRLGISTWTLYNHLDAARRRVGARTNHQLIALYARTRDARRSRRRWRD